MAASKAYVEALHKPVSNLQQQKLSWMLAICVALLTRISAPKGCALLKEKACIRGWKFRDWQGWAPSPNAG